MITMGKSIRHKWVNYKWHVAKLALWLISSTGPINEDQPGYPPSLVRVVKVHSEVCQSPKLHADGKDTDRLGECRG